MPGTKLLTRPGSPGACHADEETSHYEGATRVDGPGGRWNSFIFFSDPDGNTRAVQERPATT
jgi:hypothetical protein